jgi:aminopeptidase-like protein
VLTKHEENVIGAEIHALAARLFPICRSITGEGIRDTLAIIKEELPDLVIHEIPSGTPCFDWTIPREWNIRDAYIANSDGEKIVDFKASNLHVVSYSVPVDREIELEELQAHLHSRPDRPEAIPYVTSYYEDRWGFCLTHRQRESLTPGLYRAVIDSTLAPGYLTYGELVIPGKSEDEILISTYVCHPSMGNNELSGPSVVTRLAKFVSEIENRKFTYRFVFIPETIGSIAYISRNLDHLKTHVKAGFVVTCVGDERCYSHLPSRDGNTLSDNIAHHVLSHIDPNYRRYSFLDRGSDERQYCAPGVDLPMTTLMRSKYGTYPEYHTSDDDLDLITPDGLYGSYRALSLCVICLEANEMLQSTVLCEPQLGRRGLYPTLSVGSHDQAVRRMVDLIAYCDGSRSLLEISETIGAPMWEMLEIVDRLKQEGVIAQV